MNNNEWNKDEIVSHVTVRFGFWDTVRIIFRRKTLITVRVKTENLVGRTTTESSCHVYKIFPKKHGPAVASLRRDANE